MQGILAFAKHLKSFWRWKVNLGKKLKFFSYSFPPVLPHLHWSFTSERCEKYCFPTMWQAVHLYHLLTLDPSISLFSFCYYQLPFLFFISLCLMLWILIPKETMLLQVLTPQQHTRSDNHTPPPAQGILYSPSAPSLGWPHTLTLSSASAAL